MNAHYLKNTHKTYKNNHLVEAVDVDLTGDHRVNNDAHTITGTNPPTKNTQKRIILVCQFFEQRKEKFSENGR